MLCTKRCNEPAIGRVNTRPQETTPQTEYEEHCEYLEREYGISYEDWYLEMRIESTMGRRPASVPEQLYLPGLYPEHDFAIESY
jgi:hypothetical protein